MKRPSFFYGAAIAFAIAVSAGALFSAIAPLLGAAGTLRFLVPAMGLAYLVCLLRRSPETSGRITAIVLWFGVSCVAWVFTLPFPLYVLVQAGMLWLVRSLYFHSGLFASLLDLGLTALSVCAASWAISRSGSVFLAAWCFFLVQAAFVFIPSWSRPRSGADPDTAGDEHFECARRRADAALRQLLTR
jgi:hypothetical protein